MPVFLPDVPHNLHLKLPGHFHLGNDILLDAMNLSHIVYLEFNRWIDTKTLEIGFNRDESFAMRADNGDFILSYD